MKDKLYFLPMLLLFMLNGCKKSQSIDNRINFIFGNERAQYINTTTARIKVRFFANSSYNPDQLLQPSFFSLDTSGQVLSDNTNAFSINYSMHEISRTIVQNPSAPVSLLILINKSNEHNLDQGYDQIEYLNMETALINYYKNRPGYEINIAAFSSGNSNMQSDFQTVSPGFENNISTLNINSLGLMFDATKNAGPTAMGNGIDNALNYINKNAHYANRAIVVLTDLYSDVADTNQINTLTSKAVAYNTSINFVNTDLPAIPFSYVKLATQANGMICFPASISSAANYDLSLAGLNAYLTGGAYYQSVIEIKTDKSIFNQLTWALFYGSFATYNNKNNSDTFRLLYER